MRVTNLLTPEVVMKVYLVWAEHDNGGGVVGIYKDKVRAEDIAEMYQDEADIEHSRIEYVVEEYTVQ